MVRAFSDAWVKLAIAATVLEQSDDPGSLVSLTRRFEFSGNPVRLPDPANAEDRWENADAAQRLIAWPRIILTGKFGALGPTECQEGDVVVLLDGAPLEVVLRPVGGGDFIYIGRAVATSVAEESWDCFKAGQLEDFEKFCLI